MAEFPIDFSDPDKFASWAKFEEPVSADYVTDAGDVIQDGGVLRITANKRGTSYSNHVIAQKRLNSTGTDGTFTYSCKAMFLADPNDNYTFPQSGIEISVQNTREVAGPNWLTNTMGIQYIANPWGPPHWNAWKETAPGVAQWVQMDTAPVLFPNRWYELELVADMQAKTYTSFVVRDISGATPVEYDFTPLIVDQPIADEDKWGEAALWVTCEAENLYSGDHSGSRPYITEVFYDDVDLEIVPPPAP